MKAEKTILNCPDCNKKVRLPLGKHIKFACPQCCKEIVFDGRADCQNLANADDEELEKIPTSYFIVLGAAFILSFPTFGFIRQIIPRIQGFYYIDSLLIYVGLLFGLIYLFSKIKGAVVAVSLLVLALLSYGTIWGDYGFASFFSDIFLW